jgi:sulfite exporter TauE/SafE
MPWLLFFAFEVGTYLLLGAALGGLGEPDQWTTHNTITANWVKAVWFILGHLLLTVVGYLALAQRLPQKHRGQVLPWFWRSLLAMVVEVVVLMA